MTETRYDVLGLGNAIVDVIARTDDDFLAKQNLNKGAMTLIEEGQAERLFQAMGPAEIISGGCAANTASGVASLGGRAAFIGKVRKDTLGDLFAQNIRAFGVDFATSPAISGPATARSFILVTPDGERTMNTYLGACQGLGPDDVAKEAVEGSAFTYLEGYLWDPPLAKEAFRKAAHMAHGAARKVALTLSDAFCVDRYRDEFMELLRSRLVDILFANEHELKSLFTTEDFETALAGLRETGALGVVTRGPAGAMTVTREETFEVPAFPIERLVDTTGAGDLFAGGFLFGLARGLPEKECLRLGALAAAEVIQHIGARPQRSLEQMAQQEGLAV
ncbi:MAG: adenosine kinase [Hyphomicrobiales bacterium]|nr:adenosine kinase [Hyphomicrobiales bacterium]